MVNIACINPSGYGKSLWLCKNIYDTHISNLNLPIVTNMYLKNLPNQKAYHYIDDPFVIMDLRECLLVVDELHKWLKADSRMSSTEQNSWITEVCSDLRKQQVELRYSDQKWNSADNRIRLNVNTVCAPYFDDDTELCRCYFFQSFEDYLGFKDSGVNRSIANYIFYANDYYRFFDTWQHIEVAIDKGRKKRIDNLTVNFKSWLKSKNYDKKPNFSVVKLWSVEANKRVTREEMDLIITKIQVESNDLSGIEIVGE